MSELGQATASDGNAPRRTPWARPPRIWLAVVTVVGVLTLLFLYFTPPSFSVLLTEDSVTCRPLSSFGNDAVQLDSLPEAHQIAARDNYVNAAHDTSSAAAADVYQWRAEANAAIADACVDARTNRLATLNITGTLFVVVIGFSLASGRRPSAGTTTAEGVAHEL